MEGWWNNHNGDVELVSSFPTQLESPKTEFGIKRYAQNGEEAGICFSDFLSGLGGSTARGSTGSTAGPVVPLVGSTGSTAPRRARKICARKRDFGRKNGPKITKSKGKTMELGYANAREARSTSLA